MSKGAGNKTLLWVVVVIALLLIIAYATGFFKTEVDDAGSLPSIDVEGGELPDIDSDVGDIEVDTEEVTIETPTIDVEEATPDEE
ncbi:hypothetical protein [Sphingomicrobium aestuariivivum]|uniref:hypothetical protein n=1 Tax=Sphingomicrobium aestuariivivum TaxID=1582356 RepID=UPI001FD7153B|nr:hypothetical protein [Sphingomicrobium aestuariivivum]MCJ8190472.1 hypothetical protein [Sphingomicrobium aestuariivivum]